MLFIHCALLCEARPFIERWRLRATIHRPFKIYESDHHCLVVSGIGKTATAAALAYAFLYKGEPYDSIWLNVGVAGSGQHDYGAIVAGGKIVDSATKSAWYPPRVFSIEAKADTITTFDTPQTDYTYPGLFDMEASGFYATASRFSSNEWVQCLKVVSDNSAEGIHAVTEERVTQLVAARSDIIDQQAQMLVRANDDWRKVNQDPPFYRECLAQWRWTATEQQQLKRLLQRLAVLSPNVSWLDRVQGAHKSRVLQELAQYLQQLPVEL